MPCAVVAAVLSAPPWAGEGPAAAGHCRSWSRSRATALALGGRAVSFAEALSPGSPGVRFGVPSASGVCARLLRGRPAPSAFADVCPEGLRCVSAQSRFGVGHNGVPRPREGPAPTIEKEIYEWGCPFKDGFSELEYTTGAEGCLNDTDCLCIGRASPEFQTTLDSEGRETVTGKFRVLEAKGKDFVVQEKLLSVVPHYRLRKLPNTINPHNPHADIGDNVELHHDVWVDQYRFEARKLQNVLDELKEAISSAIHKYLLKSADSIPLDEVGPLVGRLRRFELLSRDCDAMQRTAAAFGHPEFQPTSPWPASAGHDPQWAGDRDEAKVATQGPWLNCFKVGRNCHALNCYADFDDAVLRSDLAQLRAKLAARFPERDVGVPDEVEDEATPLKAPPAADSASPATPLEAGPAVAAGSASPAEEPPPTTSAAPFIPPSRPPAALPRPPPAAASWRRSARRRRAGGFL